MGPNEIFAIMVIVMAGMFGAVIGIGTVMLMRWLDNQSCFISRKKDKIAAVFAKVGSDVDEGNFIAAFKQMYPRD